MGNALSPFQGANEENKFIQAGMNYPTNTTASGVVIAVANIDGSPIGTNITVSGAGTTPQTPDYVRLEDGTTTNLATVAAFHNADNQSLSGTSYGLFTGGVAQIVNQPGTLDRARETGIDNIASVGVPAGSQQLGVPFNSSVAASISTGSQVVTPASMAGIKVGSQVLVDTGTNQETVVVTATTSTTFTATFAKSHTGPGIPTVVFWYNQARDASVGDRVTASGLSPSATFLYNNNQQVFEYDRSANGELDGASGQGTSIAAEYEFNGGGPGTAISQSGVNNFDRARNLSGKGFTSSNITAGGGATSTAVTLASTTGLMPGSPVYFDITTSGTQEVAYVTPTYAPGTNPVYLQTALINSHTNASWDSYSPNGPGLNGFLATGIGIEEEALYNPVDGKFYIERSATQDGVAGANVVMENPALFNGVGFDRATGSATRGADVNITRGANVIGQVVVASGISVSGTVSGFTVYNERTNSAPAAGVAMLARYVQASPGNLTDGQMIMPLVDNFGQLKVVQVNVTSTNVSQFGGTNLSTGVGASGLGIPRVTTSNDSKIIITDPAVSSRGANVVQVGDTSGNTKQGFLVYTTTSGSGANSSINTFMADTSGNVFTSPAVYVYSNIAGNGTTTVKTIPGRLHSVTVNTKGATSTATIYDSLAGSGTKIATIDTTANVGTLVYDCLFNTGLTVVTTGGTPADITLSFN